MCSVYVMYVKYMRCVWHVCIMSVCVWYLYDVCEVYVWCGRGVYVFLCDICMVWAVHVVCVCVCDIWSVHSVWCACGIFMVCVWCMYGVCVLLCFVSLLCM